LAEANCRTNEIGSNRRGLFLGWQMVAVSFFVDFLAVGFFFYSYGVFYKALTADFGGSRFGVGMGLFLANVVGALLAPFLGRALDRYPVRRIMLAGATAVSLGYLLLSRIGEQWQFLLIMGTLFAVGMSTMGGLSTAKLVANWFELRRGTALGLATTGISLSGFVMPGVATLLIAEQGWRGGFAIYGILTLVLVVPVVWRFVVNRPEDLGMRPDGDDPIEIGEPRPEGDVAEWRTREILRSRNFWAIALPFSMVLSALSALLIHLVPHVTDLGFSAERAATVLSLCAGAGVLGKIAFGSLVDRIDPRVAVWSSLGFQVAGLLLLMSADLFPWLVLAAGVFGFGMGGAVPLQGALTGQAFGRHSFGKAMGLLRPVMVPIHAAGIPFAGWIYDRTGSYDLAFQIFLGMYALAFLAVAGMRLGNGHRARA
jgi:MFS family permease